LPLSKPRALEQRPQDIINPEKGFLKIFAADVRKHVEAIANATGVMRLDPGSSLSKPSVSKRPRRRSFS
jgi:hypothetical protein